MIGQRPVSRTLGRRLAGPLVALALAAWPTSAMATLELIMFDADWCGVCKKWKRDVLPGYRETDLGAVIAFGSFDMKEQNSPLFDIKEKIREVPVFVLFQSGIEVARFTGYKDAETFWRELGKVAGPHVARYTRPQRAAAR